MTTRTMKKANPKATQFVAMAVKDYELETVAMQTFGFEGIYQPDFLEAEDLDDLLITMPYGASMKVSMARFDDNETDYEC